MGDFYQNGTITTLHNLGQRPLEAMEQELMRYRAIRPMGLVLPSLFSELERPALSNIIDQLCEVPYLDEIVIGLDQADQQQYRFALDYFSRLPQHHRILWHDGPRLLAIDEQLQQLGLAPAQLGKGRNVWYCFGYMMARDSVEAIALHDCDILTYHRSLLARLLYPVANPNFSYAFCKGYYARVADNLMGGRVVRLFVTPLIRALKKVLGTTRFLDYLDSFRYPLAGEFSMRSSVINDLRVPGDWGLEIGVLSEMNRNFATNRVCQVDIAEIYDHKHQEVSLDDKSKGLSRMSVDIAKALFRKLATDGEVLSPESFRSIKATYYRLALEFIDSYQNDARINGLDYDRHTEEETVELFASNIMEAGEHFLDKPMEKPFIPSWNRVISAIPDILVQLQQAVESDHQTHGNQ